jgi:hypothetical protein
VTISPPCSVGTFVFNDTVTLTKEPELRRPGWVAGSFSFEARRPELSGER